MFNDYPLINSLFGNSSVICRDMDIDAHILNQHDVLLPLLCLQIEKVIAGTDEESKVIQCKYIKTEESLFYVKVEGFEFLNTDRACEIINDFTGIAISQNLIERLPNGDYDITKAVVHFRTQLSNIQNEIQLSAKQLIKLTDNSSHKPEKEFDMIDDIEEKDEMPLQAAINKQEESQRTMEARLEKENKLRLLNEQKELIEAQLKQSDIPLKFSDIYSEQTADVKKLFEEIAILQTASHLNKFPEMNISDVSGKDLAEVSFETIFHATIAAPYALKCLADFCGALSCQLKLLTNTVQIRSILDAVVDKRTSNSGDQGSKSWYTYAKKKAPLLKFNDDVESCLKFACTYGQINLNQFFDSLLNTSHPAIEEFSKANFEPVKTLNIVKASRRLKENLSAKVIGQDSAIDSLSKGFLSSAIKPNQGPRLIYTFVGPSGVGKTYSANVFAELLKEIEGSDYTFSNYSMESYSEEKDAGMLFGSGSQYSDSALGNLTTSVRNYPRQVILFDEIEKAHHSVITSLLTLLDTGIALDKTEQTPVDFRQCIVIFTSNLGQEAFLKNKTEQSLNVFEVLKTAKHPVTGVGFSPELVNRLSKGYPVIFNSLRMNHLIWLAEKEIEAPANLEGVSFKFSTNFSSLLLQSISPDISVRRLQSSMAKFQADVLIDAFAHIDNIETEIVINVTVDDSLQGQSEALKILIIDDDNRLVDKNKQFNTDERASNFVGVEIKHCRDINNLEQNIADFKPDVVLLDTDVILLDKDLTDPWSVLNKTINKIVESNKNIAIFTYYLYGRGTPIDLACVHYEIREHFSLKTKNNVIEQSEQFDYLIERIRYYLTTERKVRRIAQRHETLNYSLEFTKADDCISVNVCDFNIEQMVFSEDLTNSSFFDFSLPDICLDDIIGLTRAKKRLTEVIGWMMQPKKLASLQVDLPTGFLFSGPPGTGKTLLAKALAGECQLPFFSVSAADLSSKFSGGTTENIKQLFKTARKYAPSIIFIDEIDAIGRKRSQGNSNDGNLVVNTLLTEMDGFNKSDEPIFVLAATNYPEVLDSALTRPGRFDETIVCDLPNKEARQQFFEIFIKKQCLQWAVNDIEQLISRTQGLSSAELDQSLRESLYQALSDDGLVTVKHVHDSITRISYGLPSNNVVMSEEEKERTAYHETGHLLAYKLLFPALPVDFITIIPRDQALGFVATGRPDKYNGNTRVSIGKHLQVILAGRVAEKILKDSAELISTGASSDIEKATSMAMSAIYEGGLSEEIGAVNLSMLTKFEESSLLHTAQDSVRSWILESEKEVEKLLKEHFDLFDYFAKQLLQKESMHGEEINDVIDMFNQ